MVSDATTTCTGCAAEAGHGKITGVSQRQRETTDPSLSIGDLSRGGKARNTGAKALLGVGLGCLAGVSGVIVWVGLKLKQRGARH